MNLKYLFASVLSLLILTTVASAQVLKPAQTQPYVSDRVRDITPQETPPSPPPASEPASGPRYEVVIKHSDNQRDSWARAFLDNSDLAPMPTLRIRNIADLDNIEVIVLPGRWCQSGCQTRTTLKVMMDDAFRGADPAASSFPMQSIVNRIPAIGIDPRVNMDGHLVRGMVGEIVPEEQISSFPNRTVRLNAILEVSRNQEVDMLDLPMSVLARFSILIQMNSDADGFSFDERPWPWSKDF